MNKIETYCKNKHIQKVTESRNLEDFRLNEYLTPYLVLLANGPDTKVEMSYNTYAIHAFYSTTEDIKDLESQQPL